MHVEQWREFSVSAVIWESFCLGCRFGGFTSSHKSL